MKQYLLGTGIGARIAYMVGLVGCATMGYAQYAIAPTVGDGSEDNPYQFTEIGHFAWLSEVCNVDGNATRNVYYKVKNDINASSTGQWNDEGTTTGTMEGFTPIGTAENPFMGHFIGSSYKMTGLSIERADTDYVGLFGYTLGAEVKDFGVVNGNVIGSHYVGTLIGYNNQSTFVNCWTSADVAGHDFVGGLVGYEYKTEMNNCFSTSKVDGNNYVGGLVGWNDTSIISQSYSTGAARSSAIEDTTMIGGLVGYNSPDSNIVGSHSIAEIDAVSATHVGGLVGMNDGVISNCYYAQNTVHGAFDTGAIAGINNTSGYIMNTMVSNNAEVVGKENTGGLLGENKGIINSSMVNATSSIIGTSVTGGAIGMNSGYVMTTEVFAPVVGVNDIGGFVGISNGGISLSGANGNVEATSNAGGFAAVLEMGTVENCYALGDVSSVSLSAGFAGEIVSAGVVKCYAAGQVTATTRGGLVAVSTGTVQDSYWDKEATGVATSAGTTPDYAKTTAEMKQMSTYAGWDFVDIWDVSANETYPYFREGLYSGTLKVVLQPNMAIAIGAKWRVDGGEWMDSDDTYELPVGPHTIQFKDVEGYFTPITQTVTIDVDKTETVTGVYTQEMGKGDLQVIIRPTDASDKGAMWSIDRGATWHNSGDVITGLTMGPYPVIFKDGIEGYTTPDPILTVVQRGKMVTGVGTYVSTAGNNGLKMTITPDEANQDGAAWSIDNGLTWYYSGETIQGLTGGMYAVVFKDIQDWTKPASMAVLVPDLGKTKETEAAYVPMVESSGNLHVSLFSDDQTAADDNHTQYAPPEGAQWSLDGGKTWHNDGEVLKLSVGTYQIIFQNLTGWITPPTQQISILAGKDFWGNAYYIRNQRFSQQVFIVPAGAISAGAMWRVNAEAWQPSGATIGNLVYDTTHTIQFKTVNNWIAPAAIELFVPNGMTVEPITAEYISQHNAPNNDNFADAITVQGLSGSAAGTNVGARLEQGEPVNGTCSVWWKWTAPAGGKVIFNTLGSDFDTRIGVYQGSIVSNLATIAQDDDSASDHVRSQVEFFASANQTYYIAVTSCDEACGAGNVLLNWQQSGGDFRGSLQVSLTPAEAVTDGAMWRVDGGIWRKSDTIAANLTLGYHTVSFAEVSGWTTPSDQQVLITADTTTAATGYYTTSAFDIILDDADFSAGVAKALTPGDKVDFSWTASTTNPFTDSFWCEVFPSKTGGFDQVRTGATATSSYRVMTGMSSLSETFAPDTLTLNPLPDGVYTLIGSVNRGNLSGAIAEENYANNWAIIPGKRLAVHNTNIKSIDLAMDKIAWTFDPTNPNNLTVTGRVFNKGTEAMGKPGAWIEVFYGTLTAEGTVMIQGTIGAGHKVDTLPVNAPQNFSLTGSVLGGAKNKALVVMVDSTNIVSESDKTNNYELYYVPSLLPPGKSNGIDLAVVNVQISSQQKVPAQVAPNSKLTYAVTVLNKGTVMPSAPVYLELFASQDGGASVVPGVTLTWSEKITAPAIGQTKTYTLSKQINPIGDGLYSLVAMVNRDGAPDNPGDMTPLDNRMAFTSTQVSLKTPAVKTGTQNLVWYEGPFFEQDGSKITVTGTIRNVGTAATGPFWIEAFVGTMQAKTGVFYRDKSLQGGDYCIGLQPQEARGISLSGSIKPGQVLGVLADSTDVIAETDETDNYDYSTVAK